MRLLRLHVNQAPTMSEMLAAAIAWPLALVVALVIKIMARFKNGR